MATFPDYELITKGGISLGTNFELLAEKPLDSRLVVPSLEALEHYIDNSAAYVGMIAYVTSEKKHYEVTENGYREFGLTTEELNEIINNAIETSVTSAMEFKGAIDVLPETSEHGDMYKAKAEITVSAEKDAEGAGFTAKIGDSIVANNENKWYLIPSGDDIEDTWRPVTNVDNKSTLTFADGDKLDVVVTADGTVTYSHEKVDAPKLLAENEQTRTYITAVETDGYGHITGYKTATENVEDTDTTYDFEGQADESKVYFNVIENPEDEDHKSENTETIYLNTYDQQEIDDKFEDLKDVYKELQQAYSAEGSTTQTITKVEQNANGEVTITYSDIAFPDYTDEFDGKKDKQTAVENKITKAAHVLTSLTQNENGDIAYAVKELTPADIGAKEIQEEKLFTGSHIQTITEITQNANGEIGVTFEEINIYSMEDEGIYSIDADKNGDSIGFGIADGGVTSRKIGSGAVGAEHTKAYREDDGSSEEVWVFYCGTSEILV